MTIKPGTKISKYEIIELIGRGGMAEVYKARHVDLDVDVAIKFIRVDRFPPDILQNVIQRFKNEAKRMAKLSHSNIVKVTDFGSHEGTPYLVMEHLPGGTLKKYLGKSMPYHDAAALLLPIAKALAYAHSKGVVHRDVKPANILFSEESQPTLSDFGVAKIMDGEETQGLTATGAAIGTPEYMAPEQAMGKEIDYRVDIYSLGIIFYELVTGHRPFTADTPMEVTIKHARDPLPSPLDFNSSLPFQVVETIEKALEKKPPDRFPRMEEMIEALENIFMGQGSDRKIGHDEIEQKEVDKVIRSRKNRKSELPIESQSEKLFRKKVAQDNLESKQYKNRIYYSFFEKKTEMDFRKIFFVYLMGIGLILFFPKFSLVDFGWQLTNGKNLYDAVSFFGFIDSSFQYPLAITLPVLFPIIFSMLIELKPKRYTQDGFNIQIIFSSFGFLLLLFLPLITLRLGINGNLGYNREAMWTYDKYQFFTILNAGYFLMIVLYLLPILEPIIHAYRGGIRMGEGENTRIAAAIVVISFILVSYFIIRGASSSGLSSNIQSAESNAGTPVKSISKTATPASNVKASDLTFPICVKSVGANWFRRLEDGIIEYANESGATTYLCGPSRGDPAGQIAIIDEIISQGNISGLGNVPFGVEEHESIHKKALNAGFPVVLHEAPFARYATYDIEAFDNCEYGAEMMDELAARMGEEGTYVSFTGSLTNDTHMAWQNCAYDRQLEAYPNMTRLGLYESREDTEISYQIFKDLLKTNPEITGMTGSSASDVVAIGRAVQEAGLTDEIHVVGTSIVSYAGELLATGDIDLIMAWDPKDAGKAMCVVLEKVAKGEEIYDGMDLGVPGYENIRVYQNQYGVPIIVGQAWIKMNAANMAATHFK